jgi:flagellar biosynthesis/type III secretory pathway M-ring protein FliF/YscJ
VGAELWALVAVGAALLAGLGVGLVLWFWVVMPRLERETEEPDSGASEASEEAETDLTAIQREAERIKDSAVDIRQRVTRLEQLAKSREAANARRRRAGAE